MRQRLASIGSLSTFTQSSHSGSVLFDTIPQVSVEEVHRILTNITCKSSPLDYIPTSLIKSCPSVFSDPIARLANLSFAEGCFPATFKHGIVAPLLKKPNLDRSLPGNYRPITNLNNTSEIIERLF